MRWVTGRRANEEVLPGSRAQCLCSDWTKSTHHGGGRYAQGKKRPRCPGGKLEGQGMGQQWRI